jgi:hypothetical protein
MANVGTLLVDIQLNLARLQQDMGKATSVVQQAGRDIERAANLAKTALGAIGVGLSAGAFAAMTRDIVKATAALDDMAEMTGVSVENLSRLRDVAKIGGHDFEGLTGQIGKMIKGLKSADEDGQKASKALEVLGVRAKDNNGAWRDQGEVLTEVAKQLAGYQDGAGKVALVQDLLGKGAERYLPFLKDLATEGERNARVTAAQAAQAEELEKNLGRLRLAGEEVKREFVLGMVPALVDVTEKMLAAEKAAGGLAGALLTMVTAPRLSADAFRQLEGEIARLEKQRDELASIAAKGPASRWWVSDDIALNADLLSQRQREQRYLLNRIGGNARGLVQDASGEFLPPPALARLNYTSPGKDKKRSDEGESLLIGLSDQLATAQGEASVFDSVLRKLTEGTKEYSHEVQAAALAMAGEIDLMKREAAISKTLEASRETLEKKREAEGDQVRKFVASSAELLQKIEQEGALIFATDAEREKAIALRQIEMDAMRATIGLSDEETDKIYARARAMKEAVGAALDAKAARQQAKDASSAAAKAWEDEWKRTNDSISRGLTDALMRGFESGKGFAENFVDTLKNMFKTLVLEPTIRGVLAPVSQGLTGAAMGLFGGSANAGSLLSNGSSLMNLFGGDGSFGLTTALANLGGGTLIAGAGAGTALAAEAAALGIAQVGGSAGLGALGALGPVGLGLGALALGASLFGDDSGDAQRGLLYSADLGSTTRSTDGFADYPWSTQWGSSEMGPAMQAFQEAMAADERALISRRNLSSEQISAVNAALAAGPNQTWVGAGMEHTDVSASGVFQRIAAARLSTIASVLGDSVQELTETMTESAEDLTRAAGQLQRDREQAMSRAAQIESSLISNVRGLPGSLGITSLEDFQRELSISDALSPMDRLAGARGAYADTLSRARGGDLSSVLSFGSRAQDVLSISRDVYASGEGYQSIYQDVRAATAQMIEQQNALSVSIVQSVPLAIKEMDLNQAAEVRRQTQALVAELQAVREELRVLQQQIV